MKIKDGFMLRNVAGQNVIVAIGDARKSFNGMVKINEVGALLWQKIEEGADENGLVEALTEKYDVDVERAAADITKFCEKLIAAGFAE